MFGTRANDSRNPAGGSQRLRARCVRHGQPAKRLFNVRGRTEGRRRQLPGHRDSLRRQVRGARTNRHGESGSPAFLAVDRDAAAMKTGQFLHEREADARAFVRAGSRVLDAVEALEDAGEIGVGNADARVRDAQPHAIAVRLQLDANLALERELEGVRQQIQDDLLPHVPIHVHRSRDRIAVDHERDARFLDGRSKDARELGGQHREVRGLIVGVDASGFDAGEVQQRVHEPQQSHRIAVRHVLPLAVHWCERRRHIGQTVFERPEQQRERCPEFMTDVVEKCRLCPIELRQRLGASGLVFVRASVREGGAELIGDEIQKPAVLLVERPARIEAHHEPAGWRVRAGRRDREVLDQFAPRARELFLRARRAALQFRAEVRKGEHHVQRPCGERVHGEDARVARGASGGIAFGEIFQQGHASLADHALSRFGDDAVHTADLAGLDAHRIVRDVEVGLFGKSVALDFEEQVLRPERFAGADHARQQLVQHAVPESRATPLAPGVPEPPDVSRRRPDGRRRCRAP